MIKVLLIRILGNIEPMRNWNKRGGTPMEIAKKILGNPQTKLKNTNSILKVLKKGKLPIFVVQMEEKQFP